MRSGFLMRKFDLYLILGSLVHIGVDNHSFKTNKLLAFLLRHVQIPFLPYPFVFEVTWPGHGNSI